MESRKPGPQPPVLKLPTYVPVVLATFTCGVLGVCTYVGFQQSVRRFSESAPKEAGSSAAVDSIDHVRPSAALRMPLPNSRLGAGALAVKALFYGTLLCCAGFAVPAGIAAYTLDIRNVSVCPKFCHLAK